MAAFIFESKVVSDRAQGKAGNKRAFAALAAVAAHHPKAQPCNRSKTGLRDKYRARASPSI